MKFRRRKLASAIAWTTGIGGALTVAALPANATDVVVEVTGSHIKGVLSEDALPVQTITREEIAKSGAQTAYEILNNVSAVMSYGGVNEALATRNSTNGFAGVSLRGLGIDKTLVLLNGRRIANYALGRSFPGVDLNAIPLAVIDRIEILKDGASAIYGTDAIAGVINFITRKDFSGAEIFAFYASPQQEGGEQTRATLTAGRGDLTSDKFNAWLSLDYFDNKAIFARDRSFSSTSYLPGIGVDRASVGFPANVSIPGVDDGRHNPTDPTPSAGPTVLSPACVPPLSFPTANFPHECRYDVARRISIADPSTRYNVFGRATWQIAPALQLFAEGSYTHNHFTTTFSEPSNLLNNMLTFPASSPYYPTAWMQANYPEAVGRDLTLTGRFVELGELIQEATSEQQRAVAGLKGAMNGWDYEAALNYNRSKVSHWYTNGALDMRLFFPLFQSGVVNPFGPNTPDVVAQMVATEANGEMQNATGTIYSADGKISGHVLDLPAGPLAVALGGEYRREELAQWRAEVLEFGYLNGPRATSGVPTPPASDRTVGALFAEAYIPIVKNLEAQAALRFDHYSDFGSTTNPKLALRWQPTAQVLVRGSWSNGFHAPSLLELYQPQYTANTMGNFADPLRCVTAAGGTDCSLSDARSRLRTILRGGDPALQPETSDQWSFGLVLEPADVLSMSFDWFRIKLQNVIAQPTEDLFRTAISDPNSPFVVRGPVEPDYPNLPGPILYLVGPTRNIGQRLVEGIDVDFTARSPPSPLGKLTARLSGTYVMNYRQTSFLDGSFPDIVGTRGDLGSVPRWKHVLTFDWTYGPWNTTLIENYTHSYSENCVQTQGTTHGDPTGCATRKVGAYELWDLSAGYSGFKNTTLRLGIKNVLNRDPPLSNQAITTHAGYDPSYADVRGRMFYGSVRYTFK